MNDGLAAWAAQIRLHSAHDSRMENEFTRFFANVKSLTVHLQNGHKIWLSNLKAKTATIPTKDD